MMEQHVLLRGNVVPAILIGGIVLLAGQSAYTQVGLVGAAAFGDWHNDAPGVRRLITAQNLRESISRTTSVVH